MRQAKPFEFNVCTASDSYKFGHWPMYVPGTNFNSAYFQSRIGAKFGYTLFSGLQYFCVSKLIGNVVTKEKIARAKARVDAHIGPGCFNEVGWNRILNKWGGVLPLTIKAVPEGTCVPVNNVMMTVENNDRESAWLTSFIETPITNTWAPCTVATLSREIKVMLKGYLDDTSECPWALDFMLHDFGMRGVTSFESGGITGFGHLANFMGTDTFSAVELAMDYYNVTAMPAFSVYATEHSIMTAEGPNGEMSVLGRLLNRFPIGILANVIDSFNYEKYINNSAKLYKDLILNRPDITAPDGTMIQPGKLVYRPDSGDPVKTSLRVFELLAENFGYSTNRKGYKSLNPKVGILWGDGVDMEGIRAILEAFKKAKISACNIVFGMGGALLQKVDRDTQRFAFKSSYQEVNGVGRDIFKDPIDDFGGSKASKKGRLVLVTDDGVGMATMRNDEYNPEINGPDLLETVFKNGELVRDMTLDQIRTNAGI